MEEGEGDEGGGEGAATRQSGDFFFFSLEDCGINDRKTLLGM